MYCSSWQVKSIYELPFQVKGNAHTDRVKMQGRALRYLVPVLGLSKRGNSNTVILEVD